MKKKREQKRGFGNYVVNYIWRYNIFKDIVTEISNVKI